jgi:hypothetical protein
MRNNRETNRTTMATPPPGVAERRSVCRYAVVQDCAWVGWWEGQEFRSTGAKIVDISLRGALLIVENFPPKDKPVFFCPPGAAANEEWMEVKLIAAKKRLFGPREIRIAFRKVFPYEVFKAVVYGPDSLSSVDTPAWVPAENEERDWW